MKSESATPDVLSLLSAATRNTPGATEQLIVELYGELRRLAAARLARAPGGCDQTLQPTALVHEAVLRLLGKEEATYENRRHFFFAAARAMQDILVEQARRQIRRNRLGLPPRPGLEEADTASTLLAVSDAMDRLHATDQRKAEVVRLRFFAGLTVEQTAEVLGVSVATIERDWRLAQSILLVVLRRAGIEHGHRPHAAGSASVRGDGGA